MSTGLGFPVRLTGCLFTGMPYGPVVQLFGEYGEHLVRLMDRILKAYKRIQSRTEAVSKLLFKMPLISRRA